MYGSIYILTYEARALKSRSPPYAFGQLQQSIIMSHFQNLAIFRHTDYTCDQHKSLIFFTKFVTVSSAVIHIVRPKTYAIGCFLRHNDG